MAELDALDPIPEQVKLSTGLTIEIERLRARQFFKLLRIITNGALPQMANAGLFEFDGADAGEFTQRLVTVILMSVPEAEDQTIEFIRSMAKPAGLIEGRKLNKADEERNINLWLEFDAELDNPELDDLVSIIETIVRREAGDIQALGKRLAGMFKLAEKTGQVPKSPNLPESTKASSEDSRALSDSSPASTPGRTTKSGTSRSRGSASASRKSASAASTNATSASNG